MDMRPSCLPLMLLLTSSCSSLFSAPEPTLTQNGTYDQEGKGLVGRFIAAYNASDGKPGCKRDALAFKDAGFALAEERCAAFFKNLGERQRKFDFARGATVVASSAATGIASAYGAHPDTLVGLTAGFATLLGLGEVAQETILFHPETGAVQGFIMTGMRSYVAEANRQAAADPEYGFVAAYAHVLGVQRICEVHEIRAVVTQAIAKSALAAHSMAYRNRLKELLEDGQNAPVVAELARTFGTTLSDEQLVGLYWLYQKGLRAGDDSKICALLSGLPAAASPCANGALKQDWFTRSDAPKIAAAVRRLSPELQEELNAKANALRGASEAFSQLEAFDGTGSAAVGGSASAGIELEVVPRR